METHVCPFIILHSPSPYNYRRMIHTYNKEPGVGELGGEWWNVRLEEGEYGELGSSRIRLSMDTTR